MHQPGILNVVPDAGSRLRHLQHPNLYIGDMRRRSAASHATIKPIFGFLFGCLFLGWSTDFKIVSCTRTHKFGNNVWSRMVASTRGWGVSGKKNVRDQSTQKKPWIINSFYCVNKLWGVEHETTYAVHETCFFCVCQHGHSACTDTCRKGDKFLKPQ